MDTLEASLKIILFMTLFSLNALASDCPKANQNLLDYMNEFQLCLEGIDNCASAGVTQNEARKIVKDACGSEEARLEEVRCDSRLVDLRCSRI